MKTDIRPFDSLITQEAEKVLPELVTEDSRNGFKAVKYNMLPLMLLEAVREQQEIIEAQEEKIQTQNSQIKSLEERLARLEALLAGN